jgi:hypothetical protein
LAAGTAAENRKGTKEEAMARKQYLPAAAAAVLMGALVLAACGNPAGDPGGEDTPEYKTTTRPALVWNNTTGSDPLFDLFRNRLLVSADSIAEAEVLVVNNRHIGALTEEQRKGFKDFYEKGGVFVLLEPTFPEIKKLSEWTGAHLSGAADNGGRPFCEIYAFVDDAGSGLHTYVYGDPEGRFDDVEDKTAEAPSEEAQNTALDHLVEWIYSNGPPDMQSRLAGARAATENDVQSLVKAQTVTFNNSMTTPFYPQGGGGTFAPLAEKELNSSPITAVYTDTYFIYAVYDQTNQYDYYIFDQEVQVRNGNMYKAVYGPKSEGYWLDAMGYYMYYFYTDHYLMDPAGSYLTLDQHDIIQPQPQTSTGSTSYTTSQTYNIGGSLGFNGLGGTGSITWGMSYTNSHTTSIPDIAVGNQSGTSLIPNITPNNARWTYQAGNLPRTNGASISPSSPPLITVSTATFYNSWIWRVKNPQDAYTVLCRSLPSYGWNMWTNISDDECLDFRLGDEALFNGWTQERNITLVPPPRDPVN